MDEWYRKRKSHLSSSLMVMLIKEFCLKWRFLSEFQQTILLHNLPALSPRNNAKHSFKCDEYSMTQDPNFKKDCLCCVHELFLPTSISAWDYLLPQNTQPQKHIQAVLHDSCKSSSQHSQGCKRIFSFKEWKSKSLDLEEAVRLALFRSSFPSFGWPCMEAWNMS